MIIRARNRTSEFLDFSLRVSLVGHVDRCREAMCEGNKIHARHSDFYQWHFAQH
jgi:hypothetical protein